jgi:uncharacterized membrane protein YkvI
VSGGASFFRRFLLPGFAFKAVVIGGGYATGRELVEFFLPSGPRGGLQGMLLAMGIWSVICTLTFLFARITDSRNYRTFFRQLLGPFWVVFEIAYCAFIVLLLSVFGAAAGEIGAAMFGWPTLPGTLCLAVGIAACVTFGNESVERLFKYVSFFLYGVYALFLLLALPVFGDRILHSFAQAVPTDGWALGGLTYSGYNIIGAVIILPVLRHLTSRKDAVIAGMLCGPLAMIPAILFFVCMTAYYPEIGNEALPSNFLLERLGLPIFQGVFQLMIFAALLESGSGSVHAINERIAATCVASRAHSISNRTRFWIASALLVVAIFIADQFGLVALIANGYRMLACVFLAIYVLPLLVYGSWRIYAVRNGPFAGPP